MLAVQALHQAAAASEACRPRGIRELHGAEQARSAADERLLDACEAVCSALSVTEAGALAEAMTGVLRHESWVAPRAASTLCNSSFADCDCSLPRPLHGVVCVQMLQAGTASLR